MSEITVSYDPAMLDRSSIERALTLRVKKRSLARWAIPAAVLAFLALSFGLSLLTRDARATSLWLLPCVAFFLTHDLIQRAGQRRYLAARNAAPIRNRRSTTVQIGPSGVVSDGAHLNWAEIIEVLHLNGATVLLILPDAGICIPDSALPPNFTPDTLLAQLDHWRKAQP